MIFTYAPAGLGHLRVTDALVDSRPKKYPYIMLGSYDRFITGIHRFTSTNPIAKWIFTASQYGLFEDLFTFVYRGLLVLASGQVYKKLKEIGNERKDIDEIWVIATHFGMVHQIGAIKEKLIKETGKKVKLIVQVTDDTSQHIWCVRGADLTFVPSHHTLGKLSAYAAAHKMNLSFEVIPYPLSPVLTRKIEGNNWRSKAFLSDKDQINVAVPISGAAVGLPFLTKLIASIETKSSRFKFWVLVKKTMYTNMFLSTLSEHSNVNVITGRNDNEMISLYELLYQNNLMHLEITKPSEQSFKAIISPALVGGSLILFTSPVGRQESENIEFLTRLGLMPRKKIGVKGDGSEVTSYPRAISLSKDPEIAANFILWALQNDLFLKMSDENYKFPEQSLTGGEVGPEGSSDFWQTVIKNFD